MNARASITFIQRTLAVATVLVAGLAMGIELQLGSPDGGPSVTRDPTVHVQRP
jgi:hypothetical protein